MILNIEELKLSKSVNKNLRGTIQFYLIDCKTLPGKMIDLVLISLNLLICIIFVLETYNISKSLKDVLWAIEVITIFIFIVEYIARMYGAPKRWKQLINIHSLIDLLAIVPTLVLFLFPHLKLASDIGLIRIIRILKVFRIFRFLRSLKDQEFFFGTIRLHVLKVIRLISTILMIFFVSSGVFYSLENPANPFVKNFGDAFYFSVVTLTTVGFGDIIPKSTAGKWATVLMIISGIMLIPWQASQVVKEWIRISSKVNVVCTRCGLLYHDRDASHCKHCGHIIYQEYEGM